MSGELRLKKFCWILVQVRCPREALYQEQEQNFSNPDGTFRDLEYEDLRDLPILDSVIRETLRLHPPIHSILVRGFVSSPPKLAVYRR